MATEEQIAANRENAQKSTGPTTPEGKKRSSINAVRHGLTGQFHAFSEEDLKAFNQHCSLLLAEFNPQTYRENVLAVAIAEDHWRLSRARSIENNIYSLSTTNDIGDSIDANTPEVHTAVCHAKTWLMDGPKLQLLTLYENRIRRNIERNERQLKELQQERAEAFEIAIEKAKKFTELADFNGEPYHHEEDFPKQEPSDEKPIPLYRRTFTATTNGFVFSSDEISRRIRDDRRLAQHAEHAKNGWRRPETLKTMNNHPQKAA